MAPDPVGSQVWYAGYGSNLTRERMLSYLVGGTVPGSSRANAGARLAAPPSEVRSGWVDGRLHFAGEFGVWGAGGGAAFYDPEVAMDGGVACRLYRIRTAQLVDVVLQENGVDPREDPDHTARLERALDELLACEAQDLDLQADGLHPYDQLHRRPATLADGTEVEVILLGTGADLPPNPPPAEYRAIILRGLVEDVGLEPEAAERYLAAAGG